MVTAPASSPLPDEIRQVLDELEANERRAEALVADLDTGSLNWRHDERSWSTAQCLDHLNVANRVYLEAIRPTIEEARRQGKRRQGPVRPGWFERWFVASMEPPPKRKLSAPKKIVPAFSGEKEVLLAELWRRHREIAGLLQEAADLDLGVRFPNPFIPLLRFRVWTGFLVIPAHERRHLWQAEQLRKKPGFPSPHP
jgi:DinB family protein